MRSLLLLGLVLAVALAHAQSILAARVNGTGISQEQLERTFEEELRQRKLHLLQIRNPERLKQMKRAVLDRLIEQELFWQQARVAGTVATVQEVDEALKSTQGQFKTQEAFERRLLVEGYTPESYRVLVAQQVSATKYAHSVGAKAAPASDEEVHRFYRDNPDSFRRPQRASAREIFFPVAPSATPSERDAVRTRAEQVLKSARAGMDFAQLAREHSQAPTRQWGGALEPIVRGQLAKATEDVVFALAPGQVSDLVGTPEGYRILKLEAIEPEVTVSEKEAGPQIRAHLAQSKANAAIAEEAARLRGQGRVEILLPL